MSFPLPMMVLGQFGESCVTLPIVNPGAEDATTPIGWTTTVGGLNVRHPAGSGTTSVTNRDPPEGTNIFDGGTSASTKAYQRIDLRSSGIDTAKIDSLRMALTFRWWGGTFNQIPYDQPAINFYFRDEDLNLIASYFSEYKTPTGPGGNMRWSEYTEKVLLPENTRYLDIEMEAKRNSGTNNDASFDNLRGEVCTTGNIPEADQLLVYPLTYDEDDSSGGNSLTRQGSGPHITPQGFEGDNCEARYTRSNLPSWVGSASDLMLHASVTVFNRATSDTAYILYLGENSSTPSARVGLATIPDTTGALNGTYFEPLVAVINGSRNRYPVCRATWKYQRRFPDLRHNGKLVKPQGLCFIDSSTLLVSAHADDTESLVYVIDLTTMDVTGSFTFGATHKHVAAWAKRGNGQIWCVDYDTKHALEIDITASLAGGTAVILQDWDLSNLDRPGAIDFITVSGTEYVLIGEYGTSGTKYVYVIPTTQIVNGGTFNIANRHRRFVWGLQVQGLVVNGTTMYVTRNVTQTGTDGGWVQTYDISSAIGSLADGGTLTVLVTRSAPSKYPEDIAVHPITGHFWAMTEGFSAVADLPGWNGIWSSPLDGTPQENHYSLLATSSGGIIVKLNNQLHANLPFGVSVSPSILSIGGPPQGSASWTGGFSAAFVKNLAIANGSLSNTQYSDLIAGTTYEPNSLTVYNVTVTNPGADVDVSGWTNESGSIGRRTASPAPRTGAGYFFGGANALTVSRQRFEIASVTGLSTTDLDAAISANAIWAKAKWYQANFDGASDASGIGLRYLDGTSTQISLTNPLITFLPGFALEWFKRVFPVTMPPNSRHVDLVQRMVRSAGTNNDGYHDDIELVIYKR